MSGIHDKKGFTLVEIMVAVLVIVALITGGAAVLTQTNISINIQKNKRRAIDQAIARLELLKRSDYILLRPPTPTPDVYYYRDDGDDQLEEAEVSGNGALETSKDYKMRTSVERFSATADAAEFLLVTAAVTYNAAGEQVVLQSMIVPDL